MSKEKYNQIIDEVYKIYVMLPKELSDVISDNEKFNGRNFTQEEFINKCKTNPEFSEKWGLKTEEKVLSLEERYDLIEKDKHTQFVKWQSIGTDRIREVLDDNNIPTKLITLTYKNETIESYE